ncbi:hypothetical protein LX15_002855 [Streptoalloteichus tenebrarius]|uniref:Uncharacterized protein n=1 Tax=Streptoalloteichus tenebrarius (strain ATCC 17920 / DSM 40477 / JCM 4838 / CBS 697.72 / NBRC 16177 / NCIMB 11028 / NRRL B-12390 / A12253. 1 / ISP 5477) TaxID=1933 RepID=A0ABT1HUF9_STRSD|nr:hypothetical protein [Streptoalloteichus tenebrarius]MCP2259154.1 hypothetical protein [Streptoalloteichus tenebrarius]BFF04369.1 hypothetical protein GCM10020241_60440 [Streptoalloteichus tenebrarius]
MADFFDRLVARAVPGAALPEGEALVRPRLPHLFERVEPAVFEPASWPDAPPASRPAPAPPPAPPLPTPPPPDDRQAPAWPGGHERVVGPEPARSQPDRSHPATSSPSPPLVVATALRAPVAPSSSRPAVREEPATERPSPAPDAVGVLVPPSAPTPVTVSPLWTDERRGPAPPTRRAAHARPQERTVRVTIGRLEVTSGGARGEPITPHQGRPEPTVSLEQFLDREGGRR